MLAEPFPIRRQDKASSVRQLDIEHLSLVDYLNNEKKVSNVHQKRSWPSELVLNAKFLLSSTTNVTETLFMALFNRVVSFIYLFFVNHCLVVAVFQQDVVHI